jgi:hypothetical protein
VQALTFTSQPPGSPVVGQTYPVSLSSSTGQTSLTATGSCAIDDPTTAPLTVTFTAPGECQIQGSAPGNADYTDGTAEQDVTVGQAATTTALSIAADSYPSAQVAVSSPGAGTPTGAVQFAVNGTPVGDAVPLENGFATAAHPVPNGADRDVSVTYSGDTDFTGSSASTARRDPVITAAVTSAAAESTYGWYRTPVRVTFTCHAATGGIDRDGCPTPVTLRHQGAGQSASGTVIDTDGGAATVTVSPIDIDQTKPAVRVSGVKNGKRYAKAPKLHCVGADRLSGLAGCYLVQKPKATASGKTVRYAAIAVDRAGNVRRAVGTYYVTKG